MPSKQPLRRMLFRQRGRGASLATVSPDDWSPPPPLAPGQSLSQSLTRPLSLSPDLGRHERKHELQNQHQQQKQKQLRHDWTWNNTEIDDTSEGAVGFAGGEASPCTEDQVDRLAKCQKSLDQLEFSLNNLMLGMSLAPRSQRRLAEADRFLTDLVDSIRANRTTRRPRRRPAQGKSATQQATARETTMRRKLEDESRALWRAQHIGARCEDTVDRYMLDVVMDRLGEMAAVDGGGGRSKGRQGKQGKQQGGRGQKSNQRQQASGATCGKCGGVVKKDSDGEDELSGEGEDDDCDGNRHNSCSLLSFGASGASGGISFAKRLPDSLGSEANQIDSKEKPKHNKQLHQHRIHLESASDTNASHDRWTLRTWQPPVAESSGINNNNCYHEPAVAESSGTNNNNCYHEPAVAESSGTNNNNCYHEPAVAESSGTNNNNCYHEPAVAESSGINNNNCYQEPTVATLTKPVQRTVSSDSRRATDLSASVAAYRRDSRRYAKALQVAAYLRDLCREFYRTGCAGRAPPVAHDLEWVLASLTDLVAMRDRAVALAVRCTGCPALCPSERLSSPQLCRLRGLLRLACTKGDCEGGSGGLLNLVEALADSDNRPDRCQLLRQLREVAAYSDGPDANYQRLINAMAGQTELANCASNYAAHQRRMCGTAPPVAPGPRGLTQADMRALAIDLAPVEAAASVPCQRRKRRRGLQRGAGASPLTQVLHKPGEMRRRLRMHHFATGASLAVKAEEGFAEA